MTWKLALRLAPFAAIALLLGFVLWQRNTITGTTAKLAASEQSVVDLKAINTSNKKTIDAFATQRIDNDAIATAVAAKIGSNTVRETKTETIIREAKANDPIVRAWADSPVPDSVRGALRTAD